VTAGVELAQRVAAEGVDPERLARVVAWLAEPGRGPDGLRRAVARAAEQGAHQPVLLPGAQDLLGEVLPAVPDRAVDRVAQILRGWWREGVRVATVTDAAYPDRLRRGWPDVDAPALLAWRGVPPGDGPGVAIVGARRATGYGTGVAAWLAEAAAAAGARVLSGGALGIDAAAHVAALDGPGGTSVVLGCGHLVRYPRPHAEAGGLFDRVLDHGGTLLSEQLPDARPHAGNVRARNRIVAALADVVVVVEGGARSGALVTATAAAERGVPVLAVPGDVRAPGSVAPHRLLSEGAAPCTAPVDLLDALGAPTDGEAAGRTPALRARAPVASVLPDDVHRILAESWPRPVPVDDLAARTGRSAPALLGALTRARIAGETADDTSGVRLRRAPR
jgi:DNA processing protein